MRPDAVRAIEILEKLVAFDTTSHKTNLPVIDYIRDVLATHGIASQLIPAEDGQKANLFATIGPAGVGGVALSGHTDVVPVEGQEWSSDPFTLSERNGRLYGRGACDMKGFLACMLAAVPAFKARDLSTPIHLLFSYDEEIGCLGVMPMVEELGRGLTAPRLVIVGEPSRMEIIDAHKGATRYETTITGREAHSSMSHLGVNAIHYGARMIARLREIEAELPLGSQAERFTPPFSTVHVGRIAGGEALNIVARHCRFDWEVRPVPGVTAADTTGRIDTFVNDVLLPEMHAVDPDTGIATLLTNDIPAFEAGPHSDAVSLALSLTGRNETFVVSFMTEAARFQAAGFNSVVCGPGDIAQAHAPDEYIDKSEIDACMAFLERLADWCA